MVNVLLGGLFQLEKLDSNWNNYSKTIFSPSPFAAPTHQWHDPALDQA